MHPAASPPRPAASPPCRLSLGASAGAPAPPPPGTPHLPPPLIHTQNLELGIPDKIRDSCEAYLLVALENRTADRLDEDVEMAGELLAGLGAVDAYVLEGSS